MRRKAMSENDKVFAGSVPLNYDRYLVPLIFESFAQDIARRVAALAPSAILETTAGTGVVTRALTRRLSPDTHYVVTDLNQPMLDFAAARQVADRRISWRKADAQALPFEDSAFDPFVASLASCSSPTDSWATVRQSASSSPEGFSCSTYGIALRRTCSPTM